MTYENAHKHLAIKDSIIHFNELKDHLKASTIMSKSLHEDVSNIQQSTKELKNAIDSTVALEEP